MSINKKLKIFRKGRSCPSFYRKDEKKIARRRIRRKLNKIHDADGSTTEKKVRFELRDFI